MTTLCKQFEVTVTAFALQAIKVNRYFEYDFELAAAPLFTCIHALSSNQFLYDTPLVLVSAVG